MRSGLTGVAIEYFSKVYGLCDNEDWRKSLRTRARNGPPLMVSHGIIPVLAFILSKSNRKMFEELVAKGVAGKDYKKEEAGYTLYLYVIYLFLREYLGIVGQVKNIEELIQEIKNLDKSPAKLSSVGEVIVDFLTEFKKIAEAVIEEEEEG